MSSTAPHSFPPGLPPDYYDRLFAVDEEHWWYQGMRSIMTALLADRLERPGQRLLDAGCGAGGFVRWASSRGSFARIVGVDFSIDALSIARTRVPDAEFVHEQLQSLSFEDGSFDLITMYDVLQHIDEDELEPSLVQLRRVLTPGGAIFIRTNAARRARQERRDWRIYDRGTLEQTLARCGFACERLTHANVLGSLWAELRRDTPRAPTEERAGIPKPPDDSVRSRIMRRSLELEASHLARPGRTLPFGHTLLALGISRPLIVTRRNDAPYG